ncbi:uncharacterized protein TRIADDRAFT_61044 [Trichoplax adhaerens]|uniref:Uncharacterized protein n=1 Tax=Trichoplax adhaerens TaxID=10228 RepID=B3S9W0_TRIAD|nr:predicted protein [Trichoplax adhaerens]EDV20544.1 predicted protein [Trichoplax adhaerens]|eukprot:XP_002116970.1 predicted protein [Trichoplax adhaerens]
MPSQFLVFYRLLRNILTIFYQLGTEKSSVKTMDTGRGDSFTSRRKTGPPEPDSVNVYEDTDVNKVAYEEVMAGSTLLRLAYELHEVFYDQTKTQHSKSLDVKYHVFGLARNQVGPWIMRANQDCPSNASNVIDLAVHSTSDKYESNNCFILNVIHQKRYLAQIYAKS